MAEDIRVERFTDGQLIIRQGSHGDVMYVLKSGKARIFLDSDGEQTVLAVLQPGDFFGEMALFDNSPRMASVAAVGDTEVRVIGKAEYEALECDPLTRAMLHTMADRLRELGKDYEKLSLADDRRKKFVSTMSLRHSWSSD
jgi:CRP/FNR family transcriptional regulator